MKRDEEAKHMKVVIVGQGYVGLPLAQAAVEAGHRVIGLDLDSERVESLNSGVSVVDDLSDADIVAMITRGYRASSDPVDYSDADTIVICVPTPLKAGDEPDLGPVRAAVLSISEHISPGALVVLESTTYPGTTTSEIVPALEKSGLRVGVDIFVAFSPERIDPGNREYGIKNTPKVVGADDPESLRRAEEFYSSFIQRVVTVSGTAEAELTKLLENTYRHINIGLVNELAVVCHELGVDVWEVVRAASTKPFGFQAFYPGPGVGGHCIPIDPNYLNYQVKHVLGRPFRFVELAQDVNSSMPAYVVSRMQDLLNVQKKSLNGSRVLLLGVTYKSGIADTRESPAEDVARLLAAKGADVSFYDPKVESWRLSSGEQYSRVSDVREANRHSDITVLLQRIPGSIAEAIAAESSAFLDTRGVIESSRAVRL